MANIKALATAATKKYWSAAVGGLLQKASAQWASGLPTSGISPVKSVSPVWTGAMAPSWMAPLKTVTGKTIAWGASASQGTTTGNNALRAWASAWIIQKPTATTGTAPSATWFNEFAQKKATPTATEPTATGFNEFAQGKAKVEPTPTETPVETSTGEASTIPPATTPGGEPAVNEEDVTPPDYVGQDVVLSQAEYMQKSKQEEEFAKSQRWINQQINDLTWEMEQIQSSETISKAQDGLNNLKQNLAYLWSQGQPGLSSVKLNAVSKQLSDAENTFQKIKKLEANKDAIRQLGKQYDSATFEKQMKDLHDDLDNKVNSSIQEALNWLSSAEIAGKIDTVEEVEQLKGTLFQNLDKAIAWKIVANASDRKMIIDRYNQTIATTEAFVKNKGIVNKDTSEAMWYYVDGNGNPMLGTNGQPIPTPTKAPMDPIFDKASGNLISFSTGKDWSLQTTVQKVFEPVSEDAQWKPDGNGGFYRTGSGWVLEKMWWSWGWKVVTITSADGTARSMMQMPDGTLKEIDVWWTAQYQWPEYTPADPEVFQKVLQEVSSIPAWSKWWQCGSFVNNYLQKMGIARLFKDPIDVKKAVKNSDTPTIGSVAIMDSPNQPQYWHVGIVTAINDDWSLTIQQSNAGWNETVFTSKAVVNSDGTMTITWASGKGYTTKSYWYFDPTQAPQQGQSAKTQQFADLWLDEGTIQRINKMVPNAQPDDVMTAQGIVDWSLDLTKVSSMKWGERLKMTSLAKAIDPTFDMKQYPERQKVQLDFSASWKSWQQITAASTVIEHMEEYKKLLQANKNWDYKQANKIMNRFANETWNPNLTSLQVVANTVGDELATFYNIGAESWKEVKAEDFKSDLSTLQGEKSVEMQTTLMKSRLKNMNKAYKSTMWKENDRINEIMNPGPARSDKPYNIPLTGWATSAQQPPAQYSNINTSTFKSSFAQ